MAESVRPLAVLPSGESTLDSFDQFWRSRSGSYADYPCTNLPALIFILYGKRSLSGDFLFLVVAGILLVGISAGPAIGEYRSRFCDGSL